MNPYIVTYFTPKSEEHIAIVRARNPREAVKKAQRHISNEASCKPAEVQVWTIEDYKIIEKIL